MAGRDDVAFDRRRALQALGVGALTPWLATSCARQPDRPAVRDIAAIGETPVRDIVRPRSTADIVRLLRQSQVPISIGGARCSMGGQTASPGSMHVDMRGLRGLRIDPVAMRARVQAGASWRDLQDRLDPHGLSVRIMQSYSNFSIGGSLSVNCHGRYVGRGPLVNSVRALQLVAADGRVLELSRERQPEFFAAVVGGYGGLGIVTEVELDLDRNERIARSAERVALHDYPGYFAERVLADRDAVLHNADMAPPDFDGTVTVTWRRSDDPPTAVERLVPRGADYSRQQTLIWATSELPGGDGIRDRELTQRLLSERIVAWRNHEASLDIASLEPRTRRFSTYLLQEYFIPVPAFLDFAREMTRILRRHDVNALNVSIRHSPADRDSLLRWAPVDVFSFVLYHKQRNTRAADRRAGEWTRLLVDAALDCGGRHYLPYRLHATPTQFLRAYPEARAFAALKHRVDPANRFRNALWDRYLGAASA
ncbi:FAD-binding protein [Thermomonas carbonis]|uniref:FAD-binding oxidoreductase n=2 Tax=Thermomonas carbonis TaxID=1463158 RepID=A0A7G9SUE7_9GAMM|nr:FAD-binding oxidoreductase [Thermomonas carbonis]GHB98836.1 FAD-binding protein [Thermomonas carbonis]